MALISLTPSFVYQPPFEFQVCLYWVGFFVPVHFRIKLVCALTAFSQDKRYYVRSEKQRNCFCARCMWSSNQEKQLVVVCDHQISPATHYPLAGRCFTTLPCSVLPYLLTRVHLPLSSTSPAWAHLPWTRPVVAAVFPVSPPSSPPALHFRGSSPSPAHLSPPGMCSWLRRCWKAGPVRGACGRPYLA